MYNDVSQKEKGWHMQPFGQFLAAHWVLSSLFFTLFVLWAAYEWQYRSSGILSLNAHTMVHWLNHEKARLIDLREETRYREGHILGAENIPPLLWQKGLEPFQKYRAYPVILVCPSGWDSLKIGKQLKQEGFPKVAILAGGIEEWLGKSMPVTTTVSQRGSKQ